jgi:hypothetical protein
MDFGPANPYSGDTMKNSDHFPFYLPSISAKFVIESWEIERLSLRPEGVREVERAHLRLLGKRRLTLSAVKAFIAACVPDAKLRDQPDMNVRVGPHIAPRGGPGLVKDVKKLLRDISDGKVDALEAHRRYEYLHPFTDGNGRSGRAIWLWVMVRNINPWQLIEVLKHGFLREFYFQSLQEYEKNVRNEIRNKPAELRRCGRDQAGSNPGT